MNTNKHEWGGKGDWMGESTASLILIALSGPPIVPEAAPLGLASKRVRL